MTNYREALWSSCPRPEHEGVTFIELAGGMTGRNNMWQVLIASDGDLYRKTWKLGSEDEVWTELVR